MDNKSNIISTAPMDANPINIAQYQNKYNVLLQNSNVIPKEIEFQKMSENQNDNLNYNKIENSKEIETTITKKIRKRTTKSESDIRNYRCSYCEKSYLSYPALYTHCKLKHNTNNHSLRGRGRPKKGQIQPNIEKTKYNPLTCNYFQKEDRTGNTEKDKISICAKNAFKYLYENENFKQKMELRKMKIYTKIEDHPFLGKFFNDEHDINKHNEDEKTPIDLVLIEYLNKMSIYCNEKYYEKLIVFVTLFRENINLINKDKIENNKEFTTEREAEEVPESCNEFLSDFLYPEEENIEFGINKEEAIDITRNLCNWMYLNYFTCSRLFLIDKD